MWYTLALTEKFATRELTAETMELKEATMAHKEKRRSMECSEYECEGKREIKKKKR